MGRADSERRDLEADRVMGTQTRGQSQKLEVAHARIAERNAILERKVFGWLAFLVVVAWAIPGDRNNASLLWHLFDWIAAYVPSIEKAASVSPIKWVVYGYLATCFGLQPFVIASLLWGDAIAARCRVAFSRTPPGPVKTALLIYLLWMPTFVLIGAVCLFLPFDISTELGPTRGQAMFALMVGSRLGLSVFGSLLFIGLAILSTTTLIYLIGPLALIFTNGDENE